MFLCANVLTHEVPEIPEMWAYTGPLHDVMPRLRDLGYTGLEFITTDPKTLEPSEIDGMMKTYGMRPVGVNTGRLCGELGLTLTNPLRREREAAIRRTMEVIDFAANWGILVNIGILRGRYLDDVPHKKTYHFAVESLRRLCDYAAQRNVPMAIETVCFFQTNFIYTLDEAAALIKDVGSDNLGVMYDLFQMYLEEKDVCEAIIRHMPLCRHVHVADSNRRAPGEGGMDIPRFMRTLKAVGYDGAVSVEIRPLPDQDAAHKAAADFMLPLL